VTELPLLVGVDGSAAGLRAVDWAVDAAARHGVPLRLLHAATEWTADGPGPEDLMAAATERAHQRNPEVRLTTGILAEDPATALVHAGRNALALVVGARGRGRIAGLLLGSVGLAVAGRADCPVVVVRGGDAARRGEHGRIVLGVGDATGDTAGDAAGGAPTVRFAFREAAARRCALHAVRTWRRPVHEARSHPLVRGSPEHARHRQALDHLDDVLRATAREHTGIDLRLQAVEGPARVVLLEKSRSADLLVVGAHRRREHFGLQLGMVGHTVLHHADCPVALVPEHI